MRDVSTEVVDLFNNGLPFLRNESPRNAVVANIQIAIGRIYDAIGELSQIEGMGTDFLINALWEDVANYEKLIRVFQKLKYLP